MKSKSKKGLYHILNLKNHSFKDYIFMLILFVFFIVASAIFFNHFKDQAIWGNMKLAGGNAFHFCEHNKMDSSLVQTSNTWSNLGFLLVGMLLIFMGIKDAKFKKESQANLLLKYPVFSITMGISILYLFFGSFFYHASVTYFFQMIDQTGMYAIMLSFIAYNVFRIWPKVKNKAGEYISSHNWIMFGLAILNILFLTFLWKIIDINILFTALVFSFIGFSIYYSIKQNLSRPSKIIMYLAIFTYLCSMTIWILDRQDIICDPTSWFQGHALWHVLNALAVLLVYFGYRSENMFLEEVKS